MIADEPKRVLAETTRTKLCKVLRKVAMLEVESLIRSSTSRTQESCDTHDRVMACFGENTLQLVEMLSLLTGLKKALRLSIKDSKLRDTLSVISLFGLRSYVHPLKFLPIGHGGGVSRVNYFSDIVEMNDKRHGLCLVYVSQDDRLAKLTFLLDFFHDHYALGLLLGYPPCCSRFFKNNWKHVSGGSGDLVLSALKRTASSPPYPFVVNNLLTYINNDALLSHFICRYDCEHSKKLGLEVHSMLSELFLQKGKDLAYTLTQPVLYTVSQGVFLFSKARIEDYTVNYKGMEVIASDRNSQLFRVVRNSNRIKYDGVGRFSIFCDRERTLGSEIIPGNLFLFK